MELLPKMCSENLCVICFNCGTGEDFREESDTSEEDERLEKGVFSKFVTLLGRYVGAQFTTIPEQIGGGSVCRKCVKDLKRFCELFYQLERMQLELEWRLEGILKGMEGLGRLELEASQCTGGDDVGGGDSLLQFVKKFRSDVISKCNDKLSMVQPMIFLTRLHRRQTKDKTFHQAPSTNEREHRSSPAVTFDMPTEPCDFDPTFMATDDGVDDYHDMETDEHSSEQKFCPADDDNITLSKDNQVGATGKKIALGRRSKSKKKQRLSCPVCSKTFTLKSNVIKHLRFVHSMSLEEAKMAFDGNFSSDLLQNVEVEIKQERAEIQEEDNLQDLSSNETEIDNHETQEESEKKLFRCPYCQRTFSFQTNARRHIRTTHKKEHMENKLEITVELTKVNCPQLKQSVRSSPLCRTIVDKTTDDKEEEEDRISYKFTCPFCSKIFSRKSSVIKHLRFLHSKSLPEAKQIFYTKVSKIGILQKDLKEQETLQKPLECNLCSTRFSHHNSLHKHKRNYHNIRAKKNLTAANPVPSAFSCSKCSMTFKYRGMLILHQGRYHSSKLEPVPPKLFCPVADCNASFKSGNDLEKHQQLHGTFNCPFCLEVKSFAPDLSEHEMEAHAMPPEVTAPGPSKDNGDQNNYKCSRCEYSSVSRSHCVSHHVETHLGLSLKVLSCEICQAPFQSNMESHFASHHATSDDMSSEDMKRCDRCPAYFRKIFQLARHMRLIHGLDERRTCPECGKLFSTPNNLKFHLKTQHKFNDEDPQLPVPCTVESCRKRFGTQQQFEWHLKFCRHDNDKDDRSKDLKVLNCPECGRACQGPAGLRTHLKSHRRPSEYICEQCGVGFKTKWILRTHYLFHKSPEEWEYQCQECGKKCQTNTNLQQHMRVHSDHKPFVCQVCGRGYKDRKHLREHVNKSHGDLGVQDIPRRKARPEFISRREPEAK